VKFYVFLILLISSMFLNGCQEDSKSWQDNTSSNIIKALDNMGNEIIKSFENYEVIVLTNTKLTEAQSTSQSSKALYGTIDGKSTEALLKLNSNYSGDAQVAVEVYANGKLVGSSDKITIGNQSAIDFGTINTK